jgi:hypothetical protein
VLPSEGKGRTFESCWVRQQPDIMIVLQRGPTQLRGQAVSLSAGASPLPVRSAGMMC